MIDWWTIALQALNFVVLVWLLWRFLYKPVLAVIAQRREQSEKAFLEATAARSRAEEAQQDFENERVQLAAEREHLLEEVRTQANNERERILEQARAEAAEALAAGTRRIDEEKRAALVDLRGEASRLAVDIASHLLKQIPGQPINEYFLSRIDEYFSQLPADRRRELRDQLEGEALRVSAASELDEATKEAWRARLHEILGIEAAVEFTADERLIAGFELQFPAAVIRFSWRDTLETLERRLSADADAS